MKIDDIHIQIDETFFYNPDINLLLMCDRCGKKCNVPKRYKESLITCNGFTLISTTGIPTYYEVGNYKVNTYNHYIYSVTT